MLCGCGGAKVGFVYNKVQGMNALAIIFLIFAAYHIQKETRQYSTVILKIRLNLSKNVLYNKDINVDKENSVRASGAKTY